MEDVTYRDVTFPQDTIVLVCAQTGNRDPDTYEDPDTFDITRDQKRVLTFGAGPHYCLGVNLAKAEMQEALVAPRAADARPRTRRRARLRHDRRHLRPRRAPDPLDPYSQSIRLNIA